MSIKQGRSRTDVGGGGREQRAVLVPTTVGYRRRRRVEGGIRWDPEADRTGAHLAESGRDRLQQATTSDGEERSGARCDESGRGRNFSETQGPDSVTDGGPPAAVALERCVGLQSCYPLQSAEGPFLQVVRWAARRPLFASSYL